MVRKFLLILVAALVVFASAQTSQAVLSAVGPVDPGNGFPLYYADGGAVKLPAVCPGGLCLVPCFTLNPANPAANPFCVILADAFFDGVTPVLFNTNFPSEFFYWIADGDTRGGLAPNVKVARLALEGSFTSAGAEPLPGFQATFQRVRFNLTAPAAGNYVVTHPFGTVTLTATAPGQFLRFTEDVPVLAPLAFAATLGGPIGPFLQCTGGPFVDTAVPPNSYIGNPAVGCTTTNAASITVTGTDIGGAGINSVTSNIFFIAGKIWNGLLPVSLGINRATYNRTPAGAVAVDVFATSVPGAVVSFTDGGAASIPMVENPLVGPAGIFFGQDATRPAPPATVTVTATPPPPGTTTTFTKNVTDLVTISRAEYSTSCRKLVVQAASSDQLAPIPTLTATGLGTAAAFGTLSAVGPALLPPDQRRIVAGIVPPASVTVDSAKGGSATELVSVFANIPPVANNDTAAAAQGVATMINVLANDGDLDNTLNPASLAIVAAPLNGTATVNTLNNTITYTSAAAFAGTDTFTYTVNDNPCVTVPATPAATSNVATVTVTVSAPVPPVANPDTASTGAGTAVIINVLANDTSPGGFLPLTVDSLTLTQPAVGTGTAAINANQTITFTPAAGFTGTATFTYFAKDSTGLVSALPATVTVTVAAVAPPVAVNDTATTSVGTPVAISVLANDTGAATIASFTQPAVGTGTVTINAPTNTILTYTPPAGFIGTATFTYVAQNAGGLSAPATVTVTVTGVAGATITITNAQYRLGTASWTLGGNFTPKANAAVITLELWNATLTVKKGTIATVSVPANSGAWSFSGPGGAGTPVTGDIVRAISSLGATAQAIVSIRQ